MHSHHCSEISDERALLAFPVKVQRLFSRDRAQGFIEAVAIDPTYQPPRVRRAEPIACFYIYYAQEDGGQDEYYRSIQSIYFKERTVEDLDRQTSLKQRMNPSHTVRVLRVNKDSGIKPIVDNGVIQELPDGQDMVIEIARISAFDTAISATERNQAFTVEGKLK